MDKEEVLAKSREENQNQDIYAQEVLLHASSTASSIQVILACIFLIVQTLVGSGINYSLWALVGCANGIPYWAKYRKLHIKQALVPAIFYTLIVVFFSVYHIYSLFASSRIS